MTKKNIKELKKLKKHGKQTPEVLMMYDDMKEKFEKEKNLLQTDSDTSQNKYLVSCKNKWRQRWGLCIIFVAIYSVIFIPMRIAVYKTALDPFWNPLDFFTFLLYVLDVMINLRTTYFDSFGEEV